MGFAREVFFHNMRVETPRKFFTVAEYYKMLDAGILHADDHVELIHGEIVKMSPIGPAHADAVDGVNPVICPGFRGEGTRLNPGAPSSG